mmetsp:Transcript_20838/g.24123  ORF Transcript_20838/g.24123 Transcript_20838/m.24123 type:complete len:185 (+) Transcript_20838:169-723(+)
MLSRSIRQSIKVATPRSSTRFNGSSSSSVSSAMSVSSESVSMVKFPSAPVCSRKRNLSMNNLMTKSTSSSIMKGDALKGIKNDNPDVNINGNGIRMNDLESHSHGNHYQNENRSLFSDLRTGGSSLHIQDLYLQNDIAATAATTATATTATVAAATAVVIVMLAVATSRIRLVLMGKMMNLTIT